MMTPDSVLFAAMSVINLEGDLLDQGEFNAWLDLWQHDGLYVVPIREDLIVVRGAQSLWEHRKGHSRHYAADITWHLLPQDGRLLIAQKVIRLVNSDDVLHSIGYIL